MLLSLPTHRWLVIVLAMLVLLALGLAVTGLASVSPAESADVLSLGGGDGGCSLISTFHVPKYPGLDLGIPSV